MNLIKTNKSISITIARFKELVSHFLPLTILLFSSINNFKFKVEWKFMFSVFFSVCVFFTNMLVSSCEAKTEKTINANIALVRTPRIIVGAERISDYLHLIENKKVGVVANHTSVVGAIHLIDTMLQLDVDIKKIFSPEHGFKGINDAGEYVSSDKYGKTSIRVISLYGNKKKPTKQDMENLEIVIFDIQDVGVRFYTYISTLHYIMESCAESKIPLIVLDRPNPNNHFIDGPILNTEFTSFVGMHSVPVVYGLSIGEYAQMINGEKWLKDSIQCQLNTITCLNYTHTTPYHLPIKPSPNLRDMSSIYLYPSLAFFEGTSISLGRGTDTPFRLFGCPEFPDTLFSFTPKSVEGAKHPLHENETCYGFDLRHLGKNKAKTLNKINLQWLIKAYQLYPGKNEFFNSYFDKLAGNSELKNQIIKGISEDSIRQTWLKEIEEYKTIRQKYLLYKDFE